MKTDLRKQAELLFRRGNKRVSGGSDGTPWASSLDTMIPLLHEREKLLHVTGFTNSGLRGQPASLLTLTNIRLIMQFWPESEPFPCPLGAFVKIEHRKSWLGENSLYLLTMTGDEITIYMPKDVLEPLMAELIPARGKATDEEIDVFMGDMSEFDDETQA